jgi:hypothetical protein
VCWLVCSFQRRARARPPSSLLYGTTPTEPSRAGVRHKRDKEGEARWRGWRRRTSAQAFSVLFVCSLMRPVVSSSNQPVVLTAGTSTTFAARLEHTDVARLRGRRGRPTQGERAKEGFSKGLASTCNETTKVAVSVQRANECFRGPRIAALMTGNIFDVPRPNKNVPSATPAFSIEPYSRTIAGILHRPRTST